MSDTAPNMGLKFNWALGTYFKAEMDANLKKLDRYYMPVLSTTIGTPPLSPSNGDRYIIPNTGCTGAWVGNETKIATRVAGAWEYDVPVDGLRLRDLETDEMFTYDSVGGGSSDGSWSSDELQTLKTNVRGVAIINLGAADYTLSLAEAKCYALAFLNVGDGKRTVTVPSTSDGKTPGAYFAINIYAANGYYFKSETYGSTGGYIDSFVGELIFYNVITQPSGIIAVAGAQYANGTHNGTYYIPLGVGYTLARSQRGKLLVTQEAGPHNITVPQYTDESNRTNFNERYFFVADHPGWSIIAENTAQNIIFPDGPDFQVGRKYEIMRDDSTNTWRVF